MRKILNLQLFADGGNEETGTAGDNENHGTYSFEQAEEIATARAERAEKAAVSSYFKQQGMTEAEAAEAFKDYKAKKEANKPDISAITRERDDALSKLTAYENEKLLRNLKVREEDIDYVTFKVNQLVDNKTDFKTAADKFLKENPKYKADSTYRISTGVRSGGGTVKNENDEINEALRAGFRK